jgi:SAM-dependent methyltransferase
LSWKYTEDYYKKYTLDTWDECAEKYLPLMRQLAPFHSFVLDRLNPQPGERALDVATGPGEPAMSIAARVAPDGYVTGVDLSPNMVEVAKKNAAKRMLKNIEFLTMDAEKLKLPDNRYDAVTSCFGFQIMTDPEAAANEVFRVMKPGGRAAMTVWSRGDKSPAINVLIGPMLEHAEPDENGYLPTPYEYGGVGELTGMLQKHGFVDAQEFRNTNFWSARTPQEYLDLMLKGSPIGHSLSEEPPKVQKKIMEKALKNVKVYKGSTGVRIPAECVLVTASKPN